MTSAVYMVEAGPANYSAAMATSEAEQWQAAVDSECSSIVKNKVLTFVDSIPSGKKTIPTRLILQRKVGPRGPEKLQDTKHSLLHKAFGRLRDWTSPKRLPLWLVCLVCGFS